MSVVLLSRDGAFARYLAARMAEAGLLDALIVEHGGAARRRKLRRTLTVRSLWGIPSRFLDVALLVLYGVVTERALARDLGVGPYPSVPRIDVDDVNDRDCVTALQRLRPDVIVVLGTAIIRSPLLGIPRRFALNVHGGILPYYRNVHSDFWALSRGDYGRIGSAIVYLDLGVDTGDLALAERLPVDESWNLRAVKAENARCATRLTLEALRLAKSDSLPRSAQNTREAAAWPTPTATQLLRGLAKIRRSNRASVAH